MKQSIGHYVFIQVAFIQLMVNRVGGVDGCILGACIPVKKIIETLFCRYAGKVPDTE